MSTTLATRTLDRAASAMRTSPVACLPEIVKLMRTLSGNTSSVAVADLAEIIEKDAVVLAKVIGVANTFGYNPHATPVSSVNQAIHVIGYERIRSLAMSLLLVEQTARSQSVEEQRETAMLALTAGCLAQSLADSRALLDREKAFVCASLRNFGRVVMATCMLDDYREARQKARETTDDEAFREVFGLTPLQLGYQLLKAADLPEDLLTVLRELSPVACEALEASPDEQMLALTDFSARLAGLALNPHLTGENFAREAQELSARYEATLPGIAAEIPALLEAATGQLDTFARTFRLKTLSGPGLTRLKQRRAAVDPRKEKPAAPAADATAPATAAPAVGPERPASASAPPVVPEVAPAAAAQPVDPVNYNWQGPIERMTALLRTPGVTRSQLYALLIEAMREGLGAPECLLFSAKPGQAEYALSHQSGSATKSLQDRAKVTARERTVFGVCLSRNENILVHHASDPKITPYVPAWLAEPPVLGAFALLPMSDGKQAQGVVLAGWPASRAIKISPEQVRLIRTLLTLVCQAGARLAA